MSGIIHEWPLSSGPKELLVDIELQVIEAFGRAEDEQMIIVGIADTTGAWPEELVSFYTPDAFKEFSVWFAKNQPAIVAKAPIGMPALRRFVVLVVDIKEFEASRLDNGRNFDPEYRGFFCTLASLQKEDFFA